MQVNILEAKNRLSQLIKSACAGDDVIIANRGKPVARLISAKASPPTDPKQGQTHTILNWLHDHPLPPHAKRPMEEIEQSIAEERAAWD